MHNAEQDDTRDTRLQILRTHWDERVTREQERETTHPAKQIHTDLLWREIYRVIDSRHSLRILDAGAGTGRFALPLAKAGHRLTHLDISPGMLEAARMQAEQDEITGITFIEGSVDDLARFGTNEFDLVLCLDSPLSFCGDRYETALADLVRVTTGPLILCVINTLGVIAEGGVNFDLEHFGRLKTTVQVYATGQLEVTEELRRFVPTLMPTWKGFRPAELRGLLERHECRVERMSAPGTLARFVRPELLLPLFADESAYQEYLDFEEQFDADASVLGLGATKAGGSLVTARKYPSSLERMER